MNVTTRSLDRLATREPLAFDDRARRVLELRKQVREGTYRIGHRQIARAILEDWIAACEVVLREQPLPAVATAADRRETAGRFVVERTDRQSEANGATRTA